MTNQELLKQQAAEAALAYVPNNAIIGVGTGSTVNYFIQQLSSLRHKIEGAVASSIATAEKLTALHIPLIDLNSVDQLSVYIDGTDSVDKQLRLLKGGGAAMTREKIVAVNAKKFICMADETKFQTHLSTQHIPLPVEVIPMARSYVARQLVKLGGTPVYRQKCVTDNGNMILDVFNLDLLEPIKVEAQLNNIAGVVGHGLFATRPADILLLAGKNGVQILEASV